MPRSIDGPDFELRAHTHKTYIASGAPAFFFDVMRGEERVGMASLICEKDVAPVAHVGHLCVTLAESHASVERLSAVALALLEDATRRGMRQVLIVVPTAHQPSVDACRSLQPASCSQTRTEDGQAALAFLYER